MATITTTTPPENLTGWTVTVPAGWTCRAFYSQSYFIDGVFLSYPNDGLTSFRFGFNIYTDEPSSNTIFAIGSFGSELLTPSDSFSFSVSGGIDVTNFYFIQWLVDNNATFTKEEEGPQVDKTNNLAAFLKDLYEGIITKKPDASKNPQNFRSEIEAIVTGITPTGSLTITENGTYPVTEKAEVIVAVPETPEWDGSYTKTPSNLAGTTWLVSSPWEVDAGYGVFTLSYNFGSLSATEYVGTELRLGYDLTNAYATTEVANHICTKKSDGLFIEYTEYSNLYLKFLDDGAEDLKNTKLISWLSKYGKLQ